MEVEVATQRPKGPKDERLKDRLAEHAAATACDELNAAAAYVTVEGVNSVLEALDGRSLKSSRWLVGLDDAISQPGAIEKIQSLPNATVRVVTFAATGVRFHTKMIHLAASKTPKHSALMVGSANITRAAFEKNAEAAAFVTSDSKTTADWLRETFEDVWKLGHAPTKAELESYKGRYDAARKLRKKIDELLKDSDESSNVIDSPDEAQVDPALADTCWIECGRITLMGRELELKAIQARFFGLNPTGGPTEILTLIQQDGSEHPTQFVFRGNSMWRVMFPTSIPEVAAGLRPVEPDGRLGRSPFVAVFERTNIRDQFGLQFLHEDSAAYAALKARSDELGTLGDTGSRRFGWC
jgi:HKD family nuclease